MSWLFSQALVEASSVDIYSDGEQSAPLSGANTPQAYCAPDKMTAFSRLSRFGMMFKPLTENLGTELLTLYLAGFHVKTLAPLERGGGITGSRSSMWKHMARIIGEVQPQYAFVENSPMLTTRGLGTVLGDLASLGFDAEWGVLSAADVGAKHLRERIWIVARNMADSKKLLGNVSNNNTGISMEREKKSEPRNNSWSEDVANTSLSGFSSCNKPTPRPTEQVLEKQSWGSGNEYGDRKYWEAEPNMGRVAYGMASRVDRLKAIGNGQVPLCAATAFNLLKARINGLA